MTEEPEDFDEKEIEEFAAEYRRQIDAESRVNVGDIVDMAMLESWDRGFSAAISLLRKRGAILIADDFEKLRNAYWRSQGVEP